MRIQVNLASRPFVELRPFFLRLRLFMVALAVLGVAIAVGAHVLAVKAAKQQGQLDRLRDQTIAAQEVRLRTEERLRLPANAAVLDRAHFLNALFLKKSFSWTAVMMDLENVLPVGVQVTSIEPAVAKDGSVLIRLRVSGERARAVELVRNLERSRRFLAPRLGSEAAQTRETAGGNQNSGQGAQGAAPAVAPGVEFEILATYNPLPTGESYPAARVRSVAVQGETATASPVVLATPARRAATGLNPNTNLRNGYPANGVVLPAYGGASRRPGESRPAVPMPTPQGGAR